MEKGKVKVFRYNPEKDKRPYFETHEFPFERGMSVLDVALYIYEKVDGSFSFSYCCRNSHCGLCGAKINGKPGLMCRENATRELILEPLDHLPILRDLMIERQYYEDLMGSLRLFLERIREPLKQPERINLEDLDSFKVVSRCVECYSCLSACPTYREGRHEFLGPAGMMQLARHVFDPRDDLNRELIAYTEGVYNCTTCRACSEVCPHEIDPERNIEQLRARLVASGQVSRAVTQLIEIVESSRKAIHKPVYKIKSFLEENAKAGEARVGFFVGCNFDYDFRLIPAAVSAVKLLQQLKIELAIPSEQVCCGAPLVEVGAHQQLKDLIIKNIGAFQKAGCTQLVTLCSGCSLSLKQLWPKVYREATGEEIPFESLDLVELLIRLRLPEEKLKPLKQKVTYHDPCLLRRGQGIYVEPRRLLLSIPQLELIEMPESDLCCGGGGGLRLTNLELAKRVLRNKVSMIKDLGVESIVTCCPTCMKQLKLGLSMYELSKVKVFHLAEIMAEVMGPS